MSLKKQSISGVKWTTISTVISALAVMLKLIVLSRYLEKSDFGLMAYVTIVLGFATLFMDMGFTSAILHKENITKNEYSSLFWLNVFFTLFLFFIVVLISPLVSSFYNEPELNVLIPLTATSLLMSSVGRQFKTILLKELKFKAISIVESVSIILSIFIAVYLAINDYGVYSLVYSTLFQFFISNLIFFIMGMKTTGLMFHFVYSETKEFLKIGMYQVGGQVINYFNKELDVLILGKLLGSEVVGGYSLAKQLVYKPIQTINPIFTRVASPVLAKYQYAPELLKKHYLKLVSVISSVNWPIYLLLIIFAPIAVEIMYGTKNIDIVPLVRILCLYMFIRSISNPIGSLIIATGRTDLEFKWQVITLIVTPIFVFIGAQHSIIMASISVTLSMVVLFVPSWKYMVRPLIDVSLLEYTKAIFTFHKFWVKQ